MFVNKAQFVFVLQLDPGNSNCYERLKVLRVTGLSSHRDFEQKDQKNLFQKVQCLYIFYYDIEF